jgi:hypothetical protein
VIWAAAVNGKIGEKPDYHSLFIDVLRLLKHLSFVVIIELNTLGNGKTPVLGMATIAAHHLGCTFVQNQVNDEGCDHAETIRFRHKKGSDHDNQEPQVLIEVLLPKEPLTVAYGTSIEYVRTGRNVPMPFGTMRTGQFPSPDIDLLAKNLFAVGTAYADGWIHRGKLSATR